MIFRSARLLVIAGIAALATAETRAQAEWGDLTMKFVYDGVAPKPLPIPGVCPGHAVSDESLLVDANGGIANVVLYVRTKGLDVHPNYAPISHDTTSFDNKACRFDPHILTIRLTQTLELKNSDAFGHNSNLQPLGDVPINPLLPSGGSTTYKFSKVQSIPQNVTCNIHPWMKGYILPRDNPYAAVSAIDGTLTLKHLPTGDLDLQAWHERAGYVDTAAWPKGRFTHAVKDGVNDLGTIKLAAKIFK